MISSSKKILILFWLGLVATTFALAVYAYLGIFTRYMADDYCLLVSLSTSENIFGASWNKYLLESNRFSNLFILSFWEIFPNSVAFVPTIHLVLWLFGLTWLLYEINHLFHLKLKTPLLFLIAELLILFTLYTTPNVFQVLYWRPGQVTYLTPLVLFSLALAWLVKITNQKSVHLNLYAFVLAIFAFFVGGLSETISALNIALIAFILLGVYVYQKNASRKFLLTLLPALLVGTFLALVAMFLAPANALRINPENATPSILEVLLRSLDFTYAFLLGSFKALPVPYIAFIGIFTLVAYLFFVENKTPSEYLRVAWLLILIPLITYLLIFTAFAPSAYGQSYPVERVRFPAHFILNVALIALSICIAYLLSHLKLPAFTNHIAFALAILVLLYPFWMARVPLQNYEYRRLWSKRWDERQVMIYTAINNGETDLLIPALDGYEGTKELDAFPTYWANKCAANYYGVNSISTFSIKGNILEFFSE
jgi:hypothetical protein